MAKMKKGPTIKSLPVVRGKGSKGEGSQMAPAMRKGSKLKGGAGSGPGRLQKVKAYGVKPGKAVSK